MQNKNVLLAILLSMGFLLFWSTVIMPKYMPKPVVNLDDSTKPPKKDTVLPSGGEISAAHGADSAAASGKITQTILRDAQNEIIFSSKGGSVQHWRLKLKGQEVDLVNDPEANPLPLATFPDSNFTIRRIGHVETMVGESNDDSGVVMQAVLPNNVMVTKTLTLAATGYLQNLSIRLDNRSAQPVEIKDLQWGWGPGLGTILSEVKENKRQIRALSMGKLKAHALKPGEYDELGQWAALDNRYFLVAFLPVSAGNPTLNVIGTKDETQLRIIQPTTVPAHSSVTLQYQLYAGPKGYTHLGHYKKNLEEAVNFGVFSPLGKIILQVVYWLQSKTGNYGAAIIILTIGLQLLLLPLTIKSFKATMAMKRLQPQIAALQKSYKSDPKRLNIEMMNLYKKSGTNPFGGCLPMILQLPIFWALFTTLRNAYELRGAPFIGWIHDLSTPDTVHLFGANMHILPVVMGIAMFFQQRMAGASSDPTQRQMMMFMPIMFTVMFFNFPAGLVLYWLTNNLMTMAIQFTIMRKETPHSSTLEIVS